MTNAQELPVTPDIAQHIAKLLEESGVTVEQVHGVLSAWNDVAAGDPVGMVRRDPTSGAVAHRVDVDGIHQWRVSEPGGTQYNDLRPTMAWPPIFEP